MDYKKPCFLKSSRPPFAERHHVGGLSAIAELLVLYILNYRFMKQTDK